jgi:hypothetical protein
MKVFRLDPVGGTENNSRWSRSRIIERCWVRANSEKQARERVNLAVSKATDKPVGEEVPTSPWLHPAPLTTCVVDQPPLKVPEGVVITVSNKTYSYEAP